MAKRFLHLLLISFLLVQSAFALDVFKLKNGVNIICQPMEAEVVAIDIWVRAGVRNETVENNGISHFLEHLIFKGSKKFKTGEMEKIIEECGGIFNAATSHDFTHYYVVIPKKYFYTAGEVLSDAIKNPLFPKEEIEKERLVIIEEIIRRQSENEPLLYDLLFVKSFNFHPYRYPVIGSPASIAGLTREEIASYHKKLYRGSSISVVACGGLPNDYKNFFMQEFDGIEPQTEPEKIEEEQLSENKLIEKERKISKAYVKIGFSSPKAASPDSYIMDVIATILGSGRNSRLNKELKEKKQLVYDIDISYPTPVDPSLIVIDFSSEKAKADAAAQAVFGELDLLKTGEVSDAELAKAKAKLEVDYLTTHSAPQSLASNLGYFAAVANVDYEKKYLENIRSVKKSDIKKAANYYFGYYTIARFVPE